MCLECLPPHHAGCSQAEYVERQSLWLRWQFERNPEFDLPDAAFWDRFGAVPGCECSGRLNELEARPDVHRRESNAPVLKLNWGGSVSAWTWKTLRSRLMRVNGMHRDTGIELEQLVRATGKSAQDVLARMRVFELKEA